jgi:hypothetical protein
MALATEVPEFGKIGKGTVLLEPALSERKRPKGAASALARVERTPSSAAFDLDLDFAGARTDPCKTVEERRFSAA